MEMERDTVVSRLVEEFGYPLHGASLVADKLLALSPPVREAFISWWDGGPLPSLEISGETVRTLMDQHGQQPIAAFLTLDWLQRDPVAARRVLRKGHDSVRFPGRHV
jgi:hypothetical protein